MTLLVVLGGSALAMFSVSVMAQDSVQSKQGNGKPEPVASKGDLLQAMNLTSRAFRAAANRVQPALVTIESYGGVSAVQGRIGGIRGQGEGNTTGLMISPDGYILTSTFNFIQQPPVITVITSDGERRFAKLLGRDETRKVCLLKIDGVSDMPVPELVDEGDVVVGQWAVSVGVGYGDTSPALSMGIISAKNRVGGRAIQTDANISPANYGGPLIDIKGRVLGLCVPMNPQSQAIGAGVEWYDSGIGFAIPVAGKQKLIERLKSGEKILPAFVGIQYSPNPDGQGLVIAKVVDDSPAGDAGLAEKDILLAFDGEEVNDGLGLRQMLNRYESGQKVKLVVRRSKTDEEDEIEMTLGSPPKPKGEQEQLELPKIH